MIEKPPPPLLTEKTHESTSPVGNRGLRSPITIDILSLNVYLDRGCCDQEGGSLFPARAKTLHLHRVHSNGRIECSSVTRPPFSPFSRSIRTHFCPPAGAEAGRTDVKNGCARPLFHWSHAQRDTRLNPSLILSPTHINHEP